MELHKALKEIVVSKGPAIINNLQIINFLLDYQAFKEKPATKLILRAVIDSGYAEEILSLGTKPSGWHIKFQQYQHDFIDSCGYKEELASYVFESIAYAIGLQIGNTEPEIKPAFNVDSFFDIPEVEAKQQTTPKQQSSTAAPSDLYTIALSFYNMGQYQKAKGFMEKLLSQPQFSIPSLYLKLMGDIQMKMDNFQDAIKYYNECFNQKAAEEHLTIDALRDSLKKHQIKEFENSMFNYFFCLYYAKGMSDEQWLQFVKSEACFGLYEAIQFCADYGIDPIDDHIDIYFSDRNQLKDGDYLYEDGSFSHERSRSKKLIASIFLTGTTDFEKKHGWNRGYLISISPIGKGNIIDESYEYGDVPKFIWSTAKDNLPFPHSHYTIDDLTHWDEIQMINSEHLINIDNYDLFPAFGAVDKLNRIRPVPILGASDWFLPSICFFKILHRNMLGSFRLPFSSRSCWTSSQADRENAIAFSNNQGWCEDKSRSNPVLPIAAF